MKKQRSSIESDGARRRGQWLTVEVVGVAAWREPGGARQRPGPPGGAGA